MNIGVSPEDAQAAIDGRIEEMLSVLQDLQSERDSYARISRLPDEILVEIFVALQASLPSGDAWLWHRVNLVCRHWRHVAVEAPILWTKPYTHNDYHTSLTLERSKLASLDVQFTDASSEDSIAAILRHSARIRSLDIFQVARLQKIVDLFLQTDQHDSRLEKLGIWHDQDHQNSPVPIFHAKSLSNKLRDLSLMGVSFDLGIFPLPNLVHLHLAYPHQSTVPMSLRSFLKPLAGMTKLETLSLLVEHVAQYSRPAEICESYAVVQLPLLSRLSITCGCDDDFLYFLSHINLPRLSGISILCNHFVEYTDTSFASATKAVASMVNNGSFGKGLELLRLSDFELSFWGPASSSPSVHIYLPHSREHSRRFMAEAHHLINPIKSKLSTLVEVMIDLIPGVQDALQALGQLPAIRRMKVQQPFVELLINALNVPSDNHPDSHAPFPVLESITFRDLTLSSEMVRLLRQCLIGRQNCGVPLKTLALVDCKPLSDHDADLLRSVVEELAL